MCYWTVCANQLYIHKFKILGGGNLNIINQWGEPQKKGEPNFEISVGGSKAGDMMFDSNLVGGKFWRTISLFHVATLGHRHNVVLSVSKLDMARLYFKGTLFPCSISVCFL